MPKRSKHPGLRAHTWRAASGERKTAYYLDNRDGSIQKDGPSELPLGTDFDAALARWRELKLLKPLEKGTIKAAFDEWARDVLPTYKPVTRRDYTLCLTQLRPVFDTAPWHEVDMPVLAAYLRGRTGKTRANRELAVLSIVWNWAILRGLTKAPYPAAGLNRSRWKNQEHARIIDVTPELFAAVYVEADQVLRDAMDIASATGLRLTDVVSVAMPGTDGVMRGEASKTGKRFSFDAAGSEVLRPLLARRRTYRVSHLMLLSTPTRSVTWRMLNERWSEARERAAGKAENRHMRTDLLRLVLRDMRKFAANSADSLEDAADLLQHPDKRLTAKHYRLKVTTRKTSR